MQENQTAIREMKALEEQAARALQTGREHEALGIWSRILTIDPNHARTLTSIGQHAFRQGNLESARTAFQRVVDTDGTDPQQWISLALVLKSLKDEPGEESAISRALSIDPTDLLALILRGNLLERQGNTHQAAMVYGAVTSVAPALDHLNPDLRPAVEHAAKYRDNYNSECAAFMDQFLESHFQEFAGEKLNRFRDSLDIMLGRKKRYDSQPMLYHVPHLAPIEFFQREDFPWLDPIEAATDVIRDEFLAALQADDGFVPYITYADDVPLNQWAELNNSPSWSAFHLFKDGMPVEKNAAKCPRTIELLRGAPQPDQPSRTPTAMFSLLKPHTRIPPHVGVSNCRLITHLPLIIPEKCGFRVGNETREWIPGKAMVFDDTIEHEAWNDSDKLRVVLIFDIWHPHLTPPERAMITAMTAGMNAFSGSVGGFDL
ncbi:MAG: aspartyl/asparaginyl beta-hydroxylase domain-containing protein [Betaproteobacteria bacterium]